MAKLSMSQPTPVYSLEAELLSSLPAEPHPTKLSERKDSQNFASFDFQASYALVSRDNRTAWLAPAGAIFSTFSAAFASTVAAALAANMKANILAHPYA